MIIDNIITNSLVKEFKGIILNSKIQKIYQNDLNIFIIDLYSKSNTYKLVVSLNPETYRACLSQNKYQNKKITSPFLMQLKKYLESGRIISIKQINYDRIIQLEIETFNDIRDKVKLYLIIEITGKYSNLILTDTEYRILGSFRYIDQIKNDERQIILDKPYVPITNKYNKSNFEDFSEKDFSKIIEINDSKTLKKILIENFSYISGSTSEFITDKNSLLKGLEINKNIELETYNNLKSFYENLYSDKIYLEKIDTNLEINYGDKIPEISKEVENHFFNLETNKSFNNNKNNLIKITTKFLNKAKEKIEHINKFLNDNEEELLKQYGDLIYSNLYNLPEKAEFVEVENYYKDNEIIRIDLDSEKTLSENAQYFLKRYAKLKGTREVNKKMLLSLEFEDSFLEDILFNIDNSTSVEDLKEIEQELQEENYISSKNKEKSKKKNELRKSDLLSFNYNDVDILVGKSNSQNEFLTMKYASPQDIWLHARLIPGSHVVIRTENGNKKLSDELISYAAKLAAKYSKAKYSSNVCVVYTKIKNVKKPPGSKAGYVTYSNEKAVYVTPDF